jgi:hypothetical protein
MTAPRQLTALYTAERASESIGRRGSTPGHAVPS